MRTNCGQESNQLVCITFQLDSLYYSYRNYNINCTFNVWIFITERPMNSNVIKPIHLIIKYKCSRLNLAIRAVHTFSPSLFHHANYFEHMS